MLCFDTPLLTCKMRFPQTYHPGRSEQSAFSWERLRSNFIIFPQGYISFPVTMKIKSLKLWSWRHLTKQNLLHPNDCPWWAGKWSTQMRWLDICSPRGRINHHTAGPDILRKVLGSRWSSVCRYISLKTRGGVSSWTNAGRIYNTFGTPWSMEATYWMHFCVCSLDPFTKQSVRLLALSGTRRKRRLCIRSRLSEKPSAN